MCFLYSVFSFPVLLGLKIDSQHVKMIKLNVIPLRVLDVRDPPLDIVVGSPGPDTTLMVIPATLEAESSAGGASPRCQMENLCVNMLCPGHKREWG